VRWFIDWIGSLIEGNHNLQVKTNSFEFFGQLSIKGLLYTPFITNSFFDKKKRIAKHPFKNFPPSSNWRRNFAFGVTLKGCLFAKFIIFFIIIGFGILDFLIFVAYDLHKI